VRTPPDPASPDMSGKVGVAMLWRVVIRRNSNEPVRWSGLLHTSAGCGIPLSVICVSVSQAARTKPFSVSIGICSPMPWITTTACLAKLAGGLALLRRRLLGRHGRSLLCGWPQPAIIGSGSRAPSSIGGALEA